MPGARSFIDLEGSVPVALGKASSPPFVGQARPLHALGALAAVLLACAACWFGHEPLTDMVNGNLALFFILLVGVCVAAGTPIGYSFGAATLAYLATTTDIPLSIE